MADMAANLTAVLARIRTAAQRANRKPDEVRLILVSKTVPPEKVLEAAQAGSRDFGENRVQELLEKKQKIEAGSESFARDLRWHMIGRLQTNKVKRVLPQVALIHSLDRPELAKEIARQAAALGMKRVPCLIQVNGAGEATKAGVALFSGLATISTSTLVSAPHPRYYEPFKGLVFFCVY